jgi:hypothetical protein
MARVESVSARPLSIQPIFVVGVPRSGTTWVQRMLAMHPEAWGLLETYVFSRHVGLGALLRPVPPSRAPDDLALAPAGLGRIFTREELVVELRAIAERWLVRGSDDSRFVIEKSPWHLSDLDVIAEVLPEARFVHVIRDGRDVAVSMVAARGSWSRFGRSTPAAVVREAAGLWADAMRRGDEREMLLGDRLVEVRFEELKADPRAACRRIFAHCGMPSDEELVATVVQATEFGRSPGDAGEDRAARAGRVGDWRDRFGMRDAWSFERRAGAALRETGYEPDPRWWRRCRLRSGL